MYTISLLDKVGHSQNISKKLPFSQPQTNILKTTNQTILRIRNRPIPTLPHLLQPPLPHILRRPTIILQPRHRRRLYLITPTLTLLTINDIILTLINLPDPNCIIACNEI